MENLLFAFFLVGCFSRVLGNAGTHNRMVGAINPRIAWNKAGQEKIAFIELMTFMQTAIE